MFYQNSAILSTIHLIEDHLSRLTSVYERIEERRTEDDILKIAFVRYSMSTSLTNTVSKRCISKFIIPARDFLLNRCRDDVLKNVV